MSPYRSRTVSRAGTPGRADPRPEAWGPVRWSHRAAAGSFAHSVGEAPRDRQRWGCEEGGGEQDQGAARRMTSSRTDA